MAQQQRWISLAEASRELGHEKSYISRFYRRHQNEIPNGLIIGNETNKLISDDGIKWIKKHAKKEGVLVSN